MKLTRTIIIATLSFWVAQLVLFGLVLTAWFVHWIVQFFACLGLPFPEAGLQTFLSRVLKVFTYPVCLFHLDSQFGDGSLAAVLLFGADSVIWGLGVGTMIHVIRKRLKRTGTA